ncbi:hypothetical protein BDR05DRAFT_1003943 [Suillus weaverae]|nr:hypothetical protein BDR05DRAFT_1003943 [Suillus weaverae]
MYLDSGHTIQTGYCSQYAHNPDHHDSGYIDTQDHNGQPFMGQLDPPSQPGGSCTDDRYNYYHLQTHINPNDSNFQPASECRQYVSQPEQPAAAAWDGSQQQDSFAYHGYPQFHHNTAEVKQEPACHSHARHSHPQVNNLSHSNMQVERGDYNPQPKQQQGQFLPPDGLEHHHSQFLVVNSNKQLARSSCTDYCFVDTLKPASESVDDGLRLIPFGHSSLCNSLEYITLVKQYSRYLLLNKEGWKPHLKHALALSALAGHWVLEKGLASWSVTLEFVTPASIRLYKRFVQRMNNLPEALRLRFDQLLDDLCHALQ